MEKFEENKRTNVHGDIHEKTISLLDTDQKKKDYAQYRDEFNKASNFEKRYDFPIHLDLEIDNICNYACTFCPIGQPESELGEFYKSKFEIPKKKIFEIIDESKDIGVKSIQFSLVNEPLANKNIFEILKYTSQKNFEDIFIISNGSLLNEKKSLQLLDSGLKKIQFSLDAIRPDTYEKNRFTKVKKPGLYKKVIENILKFIELRDKLNYKFPLVRVSFIELEENINEKKDFEKFWKNKVDGIHFQKLTDYKKKLHEFDENKNVRCSMPYFRLSIKADGNVRPCCVGYGEKILIGNIFKQSLHEIWNSNNLRNFQKMHKEYRSLENSACKECLEHSDIF